MPISNQYQPKKITRHAGAQVVQFWDGDELVFQTEAIPKEYSLLADMIHSTLEVAIQFGFVKQPENRD